MLWVHKPAFTKEGHLVVVNHGDIIKVDPSPRPKIQSLDLLEDDEYALCLTSAPSGDIFALTTRADLVRVDGGARIATKLPLSTTKEGECNAMAITRDGRFVISLLPSLFVLSAKGEMLHHRENAHVRALAVLDDDTIVTGGVGRHLDLLDDDYQPRPGPKLRDGSWGGTGGLVVHEGELIVGASLGFLAGWENPENRWP